MDNEGTTLSIKSGSGGSYNLSSNNHTSIQTESTVVDHDVPIFDIEPVQLQFNLDHSLTQLCVQNNIMFLVLGTFVFRIDLDNPSQVTKCPLPKVQTSNSTGIARVTNSWLDPSGSHLIIQLNYINYYYLHKTYINFKLLPRFKNLNIEEIAFPIDSSHAVDTTGDFLVGTKEGQIYLALLKYHEPATQENKRDDKYLKLIYKYQNSSDFSLLSGLTFTNNNSQINAIINNELYIWDCFDTSYAELSKVFKSSNPKIVSLSSTAKAGKSFVTNGQQYVYITPDSNEIHTNDNEILLSQAEKLTFASGNGSISKDSHSLILSPHHLICLSNSHEKLIVFNKLSLSNASSPPIELNLKQYCNPGERVVGITADYKKNTYWLFTNNSIYELIIQHESISVWYNYFKMGKFEEALKFIEENSDESSNASNHYKKDLVLIKQGYDCLQRGGLGIDYGILDTSVDSEEGTLAAQDELVDLQVKGVKILARSSEPFEKVCLMLLNLHHHLKVDPTSSQAVTSADSSPLSIVSQKLLVEYLLEKYKISRDIDRNKIRITILSSWIIEILLRMIYKLESDINNKLGPLSIIDNGPSKKSSTSKRKKEAILDALNSQFQDFLLSNYKHLERNTIYQIMNDLHCPEKLIFYAELIEDYEYILNYYVDINDFANAVKTLMKIYTSSNENRKEIIYRVSTVLLMNSPKQTIEAWLRFNDDIDYERFLPAILTYSKNNGKIPLVENYGIQFLSKLIYDKGVRKVQINNHYLSLLITYPDNDIETGKKQSTKQIIKFLNFLNQESRSSKKNQMFTSHFILRLCLTYKQFQPAILILINEMNLFDVALTLALDNNLTDLGEFVLRTYDEHLVSGEIGNEVGNKHFSEEEYEKEEDINLIGKIKLEEETYSARKKLWLMFSRYLINMVCEGKTPDLYFDGIDMEEDENDNMEPTDSKAAHDGPNGDTVTSITTDLVQSMTREGKEDSSLVNSIDSHELNRVLKYILNLSNTSHSSGVLGLKDLLPLFPESIMINNFKDEIVKSLNQYNNKINQLSLEMKESLKISNNLKQQIKNSNKVSEKAKIYSIIEPGESCQLCQTLLINKNFVYFPNCHHGHHKDCLLRSYLKSKGNYRFKKLFQNFKRDPSAVNKQELDDILTKECVLCNDGNIILIDNGLVDPERDHAEMQEWNL
ncbi:Pep3/Vps18/deep orange family-domain-containing protein [Scheffersomyces xylosifermentans]|uniref:Pep3/Vps18/deep orange family-domain-containing protein n=1 Tax=Scheffersomyces xylosifermentans TaxID=1304137 RepID=UPI00315D8E8C